MTCDLGNTPKYEYESIFDFLKDILKCTTSKRINYSFIFTIQNDTWEEVKQA